MGSSIKFEKVEPIKLPIVKRFYKSHYPSAKAKPDETTIAMYSQNTLCAVVRFKPVARYYLLTGMAVHTEKQRQGLGSLLMDYCQKSILSEDYFCFALSHLESFYAAHGFTRCDTELLPNDLRVLFDRYTRNGRGLIAMQYASS